MKFGLQHTLEHYVSCRIMKQHQQDHVSASAARVTSNIEYGNRI